MDGPVVQYITVASNDIHTSKFSSLPLAQIWRTSSDRPASISNIFIFLSFCKTEMHFFVCARKFHIFFFIIISLLRGMDTHSGETHYENTPIQI